MTFINPIGIQSFFHTPATMKELEDYLDTYSGSDKVIACVAAGMAMNLCSKVVDDAVLEQLAADEAKDEDYYRDAEAYLKRLRNERDDDEWMTDGL